ncbi:MAG: hypothetical protein K9I94_08860 [Bacteroidales bacterium]|nr:hypothetical protein [Bacteroidales bacterium]
MIVNVFKILVPLVIAVVIGLIFSLGFHKKGPWGSIVTFILILFLAIWAASLWLNPIGPTAWGIPWYPIIFFGILIAFILAQITPMPRNKFKGRRQMFTEEDEESKETRQVITFDEVFWVLLVAFIIAIVLGYM